jgi:GT2 family glycosyltransferase
MTSGRDHFASVIVGIATHNRAELLRTTINSALGQSHRPLRVTVIDDASSDETPSLRQEFESVSWERLECGQGYVRARNRMMLKAREDYFVSLDDDAWFVQGDEVALAVDFLEHHPKVAAVAFDIVSPDHFSEASRGARTSVAMYIGCGHMLRLSVVKELGGYAEFPDTYGVEEKDFCLRLIDAGYGIIKLDGVHVWHDKASLSRNLFKQHRSGVCNDLALALRRVPVGLVIPVIVLKIMKHLVFALRGGLFLACLQGVRDFMFAAYELWHARCPVRFSSLTQFYRLSRTPRKFVEQFRAAN